MKCVAGFFRADLIGSNEKCHKRGENPNCKVVNELSNECKECIDTTYIMHYNNWVCSPPIDGCDIYNLDTQELSCKFC